MSAQIHEVEQLAEEVARVWHHIADNALEETAFGAGHVIFAEATRAIASEISALEDPMSFLRVLDTYADDALPPQRMAESTARNGTNKATDKTDALNLDIRAASELLASGTLTSQELTDAALFRLEHVSGVTNATLAVEHDAAMEAARRSDDRRSDGRCLGALDGIPLAHKGLLCRDGIGVNAGGIDTSDLGVQDTATVLRRLDAAGAINIARLHLTEASFVPTGLNAHLGHCLNPWDTQSVTGGSSSGSAVACATGSVFGALGSDTGGSIRIPAAICGVTGLKPTYGRVSRHGAYPVSHSHDHIGPLARSARDCAILLEAIAGHDKADPTSSVRPVQANGNGSLAGVRIGVAQAYFHDRLDGALSRNMDESLRVMRDAGATIIDVPDADYELMNALSSMIIRAEVTAVHLPAIMRNPAGFSGALRRMLMQGVGIPYAAHDHAQRVRAAFIKDFVTRVLRDVDMLHLPVMAVPTPTVEQADPDAATGPQVAKELTVMMRVFNYLGLPCLSLPCGMHQSASGAQMPQGFQLVGRPFSEARLLEAGIAYQTQTDWHTYRPSV
ncbi:amidase [Roseovarius sp. S1116L3]|uniref:amidase n=1 Tax=Roseovarius roseus TaxID=3342636 RepID=UPI003726D1B0